ARDERDRAARARPRDLPRHPRDRRHAAERRALAGGRVRDAGRAPLTLVAADPAELSIARLLDDVRVLLVDAWKRNEIPTRLVMNDRLYRRVLEGKVRELETNRPVTLLGLDLEGDPDVPLERPRIR